MAKKFNNLISLFKKLTLVQWPVRSKVQILWSGDGDNQGRSRVCALFGWIIGGPYDVAPTVRPREELDL